MQNIWIGNTVHITIYELNLSYWRLVLVTNPHVITLNLDLKVYYSCEPK